MNRAKGQISGTNAIVFLIEKKLKLESNNTSHPQ